MMNMLPLKNSGRNTTVISVSQMLVYTIITSMPSSVAAPEIIEITELSSIMPMLSTSLVKRLMISPLLWVSK